MARCRACSDPALDRGRHWNDGALQWDVVILACILQRAEPGKWTADALHPQGDEHTGRFKPKVHDLRYLRFLISTLRIAASSGGCEEQYLQKFMMEDGKRVWNENLLEVFTVRMKTPAYKNSTGSDRLAQDVSFDQKLRVSDPGLGTQRLRVRKLSDEDLGWVERDDLLCRLFPLPDPKTGLLRRVVIQTETAEKGLVVPRTAYHAPNGQCEGGASACPKLSRSNGTLYIWSRAATCCCRNPQSGWHRCTSGGMVAGG